MKLLDEVYFKYFASKKQILFINSLTNSFYVIKLSSILYCKDVFELLSQKITTLEFRNRLGESAFLEFEKVWFVFNRAGLVLLDHHHKTINLDLLKISETLFKGNEFEIQFESFLNSELYVYGRSSDPEVHEGGSCSSVGATSCGYWDDYLYECGYDFTWAGLGSSC